MGTRLGAAGGYKQGGTSKVQQGGTRLGAAGGHKTRCSRGAHRDLRAIRPHIRI